MKKQKITYGVSGMMEFQAVIKVGRNNMKVMFTDGSMNAMGVNPAKFTTTNFMVQHAIENSPEFKRGLIKRIGIIELDEDVKIECYKEPAATATKSDNTPTAEPATEQTAKSEDSDADSYEESQPEEEKTDSPEAESDHPNTEVEFTCNDDAKDYLEQTFGHVRSKLRNREDIIAAGKTYGVDIIFA